MSNLESKFRVGLVQMCTCRSVEKNLAEASRLVRDAAARGAAYVQTPEVTTLMELDRAKLFVAMQPEEGNAAIAHFRGLARELKIWLHVGSMGVLVKPDKIASRALLITPEGAVAARYDKIHMFDVDLPGGEVFTTPASVDGTFVIDGVVGDWLCDRYGNLKDTPLTVQIANGRLVEAWSSNDRLRDDFWTYTHTDAESDRVGEFAIGTNIGVTRVIGHILQDEKFPGVHIAFGNPYGAHTGATWWSSTHIDVVGTEFDVLVDGQPIMRGGKFLIG